MEEFGSAKSFSSVSDESGSSDSSESGSGSVVDDSGSGGGGGSDSPSSGSSDSSGGNIGYIVTATVVLTYDDAELSRPPVGEYFDGGSATGTVISEHGQSSGGLTFTETLSDDSCSSTITNPVPYSQTNSFSFLWWELPIDTYWSRAYTLVIENTGDVTINVAWSLNGAPQTGFSVSPMGSLQFQSVVEYLFETGYPEVLVTMEVTL